MGALHEPTDDLRQKVRDYVEGGMVQDHIAAALGIDAKTLRKHYRDDLTQSMDDWKRDFQQSVRNRVLKDDCAPALVIFTLKAQCGWREQTPLDPTKETPASGLDADALRARVAEIARASRDQQQGTGHDSGSARAGRGAA